MLRIFLLALAGVLSTSSIAAQAPICNDSNESRNCCDKTTISACPAQGCGGDPELNKKKNRTDTPTASAILPKTFTQLTAFKRPASWSSGTARTLLETWGEGRAVRLKGYIFEADNYTQGAESTNCYLRTNDFNDFHIVLVEDLVLANKWKDLVDQARAIDPDSEPTAAKRKAAQKKKDRLEDRAKRAHKRAEKRSLTAEITPRLRPDGWTIEKLRDLARRFAMVRVTGWAMLDTQHIARPIDRRSNWELHPVTKFEICTATETECDAGTGWTNLETHDE